MVTEVDDLRLDQDEAPDVPVSPPRGEHKAPEPPKRRGRRKGPENLEKPLQLTLATIGTVWAGTEASRGHSDPTCGTILLKQSPAIAKALNAVAMEDESVHRWLSALLTGGGWGAVAMATLPVVQAVVNSHVVPAIERRRFRSDEFEEEKDTRKEWQPPNEIPPDERT